MHLYTSRHRRGKSSRRSTRKSYTGKVNRSRRSKRSKRTNRARRARRTRNKMYGGGNGLGQILTNTYRFTKNTGLNIYNGFKGQDLVKSSNPTLGQF